MVNSGHTRPSDPKFGGKEVNLGGKKTTHVHHWSECVKTVIIETFENCDKCFVLGGGSDRGEFVYVTEIRGGDKIKYVNERHFQNGDILLKVQDQKVSGFTYLDAVNWLKHCCRSSYSITIECVPQGRY